MSSRVVKNRLGAAASPIRWPEAGRGLGPSPGSPSQDAGPGPQETAAALEAAAAEAYQRGYREGEQAGRASIAPLLERLAQTIETVAGMKHRLRKQAEADLVQLALAIARRILHREIGVDPEAVTGLARVALDKLRDQEILRVRTHPTLEAALREALRGAGAPPSLEVVADSSREPGDVVFETPQGNLDASVETQLKEIERGLADRLRLA